MARMSPKELDMYLNEVIANYEKAEAERIADEEEKPLNGKLKNRIPAEKVLGCFMMLHKQSSVNRSLGNVGETRLRR